MCGALAPSRLFSLCVALCSNVFRMSDVGTPEIYTTTGFGPRKNKKMAGVDHFLVYMQTAVKYNTFYIRPRGGVYTNCGILQQFAYSPRNILHQPFSDSFYAKTRWWCIGGWGGESNREIVSCRACVRALWLLTQSEAQS